MSQTQGFAGDPKKVVFHTLFIRIGTRLKNIRKTLGRYTEEMEKFSNSFWKNY
jgi:hypothetical protein